MLRIPVPIPGLNFLGSPSPSLVCNFTENPYSFWVVTPGSLVGRDGDLPCFRRLTLTLLQKMLASVAIVSWVKAQSMRSSKHLMHGIKGSSQSAYKILKTQKAKYSIVRFSFRRM